MKKSIRCTRVRRSFRLALEEPVRQPLSLHSDLRDRQHLPQNPLHGRAEGVEHAGRSAIATDDRAVRKGVDANVRGAWTYKTPTHQILHKRLFDPAVIRLGSDAVDDDAAPLDLFPRPSTRRVVHLHRRLGLHEIADPTGDDLKLPGGAHHLDDGLALRRNSAANNLPVTEDMAKEPALLVGGEAPP